MPRLLDAWTQGLVLVIKSLTAKLASKFFFAPYFPTSKAKLPFPFLHSKRLSDCAGHFGFIQLELPVFHVGYFRHTIVILQCICKKCSRVLLPIEDRAGFIKKLKGSNIDALTRGQIFKRIVDLCKRASRCPHCSYSNGNYNFAHFVF